MTKNARPAPVNGSASACEPSVSMACEAVTTDSFASVSATSSMAGADVGDDGAQPWPVIRIAIDLAKHRVEDLLQLTAGDVDVLQRVERTHEVGVRIALGATRSEIVRSVLMNGLLLTGVGVAIGVAGASATSRLLETLLYGISRVDVATYDMLRSALLRLPLRQRTALVLREIDGLSYDGITGLIAGVFSAFAVSSGAIPPRQ